MSNILIASDDRKEPLWISYIKRRIENKKNFLGFIGGPTGAGKSWAGLSICNMVDPTFNPERIVTSMRQLIKLVNSDKLKEGSAILWDEAGIDISNKSWQSLTNKAINFLMQTFRHKRFILIFTSPYLDFIDAGTRKLFHAEFLMSSIDYVNEKSKLKPYLIQYNSRARKFYYKYLRVKGKMGVAPVKIWNIPKPPQWLIDAYEEIKGKFTSDLNQDLERQLDEVEFKKKSNEKRTLTEQQEKVLTLMAKYDNIPQVAEELGITTRNVYFHLAQAGKKGYKKGDLMAKSVNESKNGVETDCNSKPIEMF